jgi:Flp pilus assembly protein TadD/spermidine synthase
MNDPARSASQPEADDVPTISDARGDAPGASRPVTRRSPTVNAIQWSIPPAIVFLAGVCVMTVELVASRVIARHLGQSLYTWTSVIGIVLAGIALGNYIGGRVADRYRPARSLPVLLILSSLACVGILPLNHAVGSWEALWFQSWPMRVALHVFFTFMVPATMLGTISPVCAKMALDLGQQVGRTVGNIYAWGAIGSIAGTFLTGYFLIISLGSSNVIWVVAGVLALLGILMGLRNWLPYAWGGALLVLALFGVVPSKTCEAVGWRLGLRDRPDANLIYEDESNYSYIAVHENPATGMRTMKLDQLVHSWMIPGRADHLTYGYEKIYAALLRENRPAGRGLRLLMIGGGGFCFPQYLERTLPDAHIEVVEIDPRVTEAAHAAFGLPRDTAIQIHHMDGRNYVASRLHAKAAGEAVEPFDFIFADAVNDFSVPFHLTTREFISMIREVLAEDGAFMMTIIDAYQLGEFLGALYNTFETVFPETYVFCTSSDALTSAKPRRDTFVLVGANSALEAHVKSESDGEGTGPVRLDDKQLAVLRKRSQGIVLTDDYAPVENLLAGVVRTRRFEMAAGEYLNRAAAAAARGEYAAEIRYLHRATAIDPDSAETQLQLAFALTAHGGPEDLAAAEQHYWRAIELRPNDAAPHLNYGVLLSRLGRSQDAIRQYRKAIRLQPDDASAFYNLGQEYLATEDYRSAVASLQRATALSPDNAAAYRDLAFASSQTGALAAAEEAGARAYRLDPDNDQVRETYAGVLLQRGRYAEAVRVLEGGLSADPDNSDVAIELAWVLATTPEPSLRDPSRAVDLAERANARTQHRNPRYLDTLAAAYAAAGAMGKAIDVARQARAAAAERLGRGHPLVQQIASHLAQYRQGKPLTASIPANPTPPPSTTTPSE